MQKLITIFFILFSNYCLAISIIRDDEIESQVKAIASPIVAAAKLDKNRLKIYIINDNKINAFTAGGTEIFINSGLIADFEDPSILQGVIAHEIGHVIAGHVAQKKAKIDELTKAANIGSIIGIIGAVASGSPDIAMGGIMGTHSVINRQLLSFSRQHENEADRIALDLLNKAKASNKGLITLLQKLMVNQRSFGMDPYLMTHPLGQWRIDHIRNYSTGKEHSDNFSEDQLKSYKRAVLKLRAFTYPPETTFKTIKGNDFVSEYCRVIALYRKGSRQDAETKVLGLTANHPNDPYLLELKAQIFMENGKFDISTNTYKLALKNDPKSSLLKYQLAVSLINQASKNNDQSLYFSAIDLLKQVINADEENTQIYHYLSVAYGRSGNIGAAKLSLAEKAAIIGDKEESKKFARQALKLLKEGSKDYIRAEQLL